jgi:DNA-binding transcriptional LysR family regulator
MYNPQLDTFLVTARAGSFSGAAKELYITPSAVLQQINSLEEKLQVSLFTRSNRGLTLTAAGEYLAREVSGLQEWDRRTKKKLLQLAAQDASTLHVALPGMHKSRLFYRFWAEYAALHPETKVEFEMVSAFDHTHTENVVEKSDLMEYIETDQMQSFKEFIKLCDIPLLFLAGKNHPLADRETLTVEDLDGLEIQVPGGGFQKRFQSYYDKLTSYGARLIPTAHFAPTVFESSIIQSQLVLVTGSSADMHSFMKVLRFGEQPTIPYGFICNRARTGIAADFIRFVQAECEKTPVQWNLAEEPNA